MSAAVSSGVTVGSSLMKCLVLIDEVLDAGMKECVTVVLTASSKNEIEYIISPIY